MTKEKSRHEIAEAFDFVRFLIHHPKELKWIKNSSTIEILSRELPQKREPRALAYRNTLPETHYLSEHTFHRL